MSTDFFRRYLDLLNEADTGNPLQDLIKPRTDGGNYIDPKTGIIMYVPNKSPRAGSDSPDPSPRALDWKLLNQPDSQEIKNALRAAGIDIISVDKPSLFGSYPVAAVDPEKLAKVLAGASNTAPGQGGQPPPAEIPHNTPELIAPNTNVALPSSGTFSNDQALANLAAKMQDDDVAAQDQPTGTPVVSGDTRCKICGTKQKDHQKLRHAFVASDSTAQTIAATPGIQPGGTVKRGGVSTAPKGQAATPDVSKVTTALAAIEKLLDKYKVKLKENISRLAPMEQMKAWRTLMEYSEVDEATRKTRRPTKAEIDAYLKNLPPDPGSTKAAVAAPPSGPRNPYVKPGGSREAQAWQAEKVAQDARTAASQTAAQTAAQATSTAGAAAGKEAGALSKIWSGLKGVAKKAALPAAAAVEIYDGYQQITALPTDMPRDQYRAAVTKIVARLVEEFGLFWVGSILGGALAGVFTANPLGAIAGFVAGGAGGIAASYLLGDSVGEISDQIVDKLYGTGGTSSMTADEKAMIVQNLAIIQDFVKANPSAVDADLKARIDRVMAATKAAGVAPGQGGQPPEGKKAAPAAPAIPTATPTAPAKLDTTLDGIDKLLKKYNFESQEFDSFFDSLTESEQRRFITKNLHHLSESEQIAIHRDMLNEGGIWSLGKKGLRWAGQKLFKAGGGEVESEVAAAIRQGIAAGQTPAQIADLISSVGKKGWRPGFWTGAATTAGIGVYGYFKIKQIVGELLDTIKDPETAKVITISPEDTAAWIQFNKELEAALPDQATYDALPQDVKDRLSMIAARAEAMDKAIKEARAKAQ
jgi:hypothetical protein